MNNPERDPFEVLYDRARARPMHVVLSEGEDARVRRAAAEILRRGLARLTLIGPRESFQSEFEYPESVRIEDPRTSGFADECAAAYHRLRAHKGVTEGQARDAVRDPRVFANLLVHLGQADGCVSGAVYTAPT